MTRGLIQAPPVPCTVEVEGAVPVGAKAFPVGLPMQARNREVLHPRGTPTADYAGCTMARLIYVMPTSLDGCIEDETGKFDWATPDEEGFAFINDLERPIGMYLYGRKMYQTMAIWETPEVIPGRTPAMLDFAQIWQAADKIVYSKSLETVSTPKTRLEREFDPQAVRDLKAQLPHDI